MSCVFHFQLCDGTVFFRRYSNHRASMSCLILLPQQLFFGKCDMYSHVVTILRTPYSEALFPGHNITATIVLSPSKCLRPLALESYLSTLYFCL